MMDEVHKTHLSNLLSLFYQKNTTQSSEHIIQHALEFELNVIKNSKDAENSRKSMSSMCTHCFTRWKEGQFTVKFKPKNKPKWKTKNNIYKRMVVRCAVCLHAEYIPFTSENRIQTNERKNRKISNIKKIQFNRRIDKTKRILNSKSKKKSKNAPVIKKRSNLTILNDLL